MDDILVVLPPGGHRSMGYLPKGDVSFNCEHCGWVSGAIRPNSNSLFLICYLCGNRIVIDFFESEEAQTIAETVYGSAVACVPNGGVYEAE